ncbi:MAG: hypothetical protein IJB01_09950 [Bacteroidaceae bacterium]|nr:hypothetical protein [Bacteroidaceae bacterium]
MNTKFKHRILTGVMMAAALFMGTSCDDSEGLKVTEEVPNANKTLYEVLLADADLEDFVEVINSCGEHCADSLFNKSRVYTLWAPVDGSFNKDSLLNEVKEGNREDVFHRFVMAHVSNHLRAANGTLDNKNKILLLNDKVVTFMGDREAGYTFDGCPLIECNNRVKNGVLHKIASPAEYKYNIMEYLKIAENVDSVSNFIYSFNETEFSPGQSIMGPIVNGEQTYLDSVFVTNNRILNHWDGVGFLDNEDSTYTVYVPTNAAWDEFTSKSEKFFNYSLESKNPTSVKAEDRDSLRQHYTRINALKYMTFSDNEQIYVDSPDSILPIWQNGGREELLKSQVEEFVISEKQLSNGTFKVIDKCPFTFQELFYDTIKVEAENDAMRYKTENIVEYNRSASKNQLNKDSLFADVKISGNSYFEGISPQNAPARASYKLPNALSAKYYLAVVTVPKNVTNADVEASELKPTRYTFTVAMEGQSGNIFKSGNIESLPDRVDTLFITDSKGEKVILDIPYCELYNTYSHEDYNLYLKVETGGNVRKYDYTIRIDAIMLIPVEETEEE